MVKANAYGHGAVEVSRRLLQEKVSALGVSLIEEGIQLRQNGIRGDILVYGLFDRGAEEILEHRLTPVISSFEQIEKLSRVIKTPLKIHIKFDTGMGRLGFSPSEVPKLIEKLTSQPLLQAEGLLTHLHSGEDASNPEASAAQQLKIFRSYLPAFKSARVHHVWATASLLALAEQKASLASFGARPGLGLYGESTTRHNFDLKPVMSLRSTVKKLNSLLPGQSVSYGATWRATKDSLIGVVPIGYADGIHRILSNVGSALVLGKRVPIAGRVCMDYVMLDLTELKSSSSLQDAEVTFFGSDSKGTILPAFDVAEKAQTVPWNILTSISERVPRIYLGGTT